MKTGIVSVGYEVLDLERFVDVLSRHDVAALADVRLNAISRRPGFSKTKLSCALKAAGIEYFHLKALGDPKDNRDFFRLGPLAEGVAIFRGILSETEAKLAIDSLAARASAEVVAIMCFEADHLRCHRNVIIEEIGALADVSVLHL